MRESNYNALNSFHFFLIVISVTGPRLITSLSLRTTHSVFNAYCSQTGMEINFLSTGHCGWWISKSTSHSMFLPATFLFLTDNV